MSLLRKLWFMVYGTWGIGPPAGAGLGGALSLARELAGQRTVAWIGEPPIRVTRRSDDRRRPVRASLRAFPGRSGSADSPRRRKALQGAFRRSTGEPSSCSSSKPSRFARLLQTPSGGPTAGGEPPVSAAAVTQAVAWPSPLAGLEPSAAANPRRALPGRPAWL